jgi:hypothetical protein
VENRRRLLGDNHPHTLRAMGNLVSTYWDMGDIQKATELAADNLEKHRMVYGDDHELTLKATNNLVFMYQQLTKRRT